MTFRSYKNPLSNHFPFVLSAYETTFVSVEHAFFLRMSSELDKFKLTEKIKKAKHAGLMKQLSKDIGSDEDKLEWGMKTHVMIYLIRQKFEQYEEFKFRL